MAAPTQNDADAAMISRDAEISGAHAVRFGARCVLHPRCVIRAVHGPVELGDDCIVEELAVIECVALPVAGFA